MDYIYKDLVTAAKQNDKAAMELLLTKMKPLILRNMSRLYKIQTEIEVNRDDLLQDSYIKLMQCVHEYDESKNTAFLVYVKKYMEYFFLDYCKGKKVVVTSLDLPTQDDDSLTLRDSLEDRNTDVPTAVENIETNNHLAQGLRILTNDELEVLHQYYYLDLNMSEISRKMGIAYHKVNHLKKRAIKKLQEYYKETFRDMHKDLL